MLMTAIARPTSPANETADLVSATAQFAGLSYAETASFAQGIEHDPRFAANVLNPNLVLTPKALRQDLHRILNAIATTLADDDITAALTFHKTTFDEAMNTPSFDTTCGRIAIALEEQRYDQRLPTGLARQLCALVARLTDRAVIGSRQSVYSGLCADIADATWDVRSLAASLVRVGAVSAQDPRVHLTGDAYRPYHGLDVVAGFDEIMSSAEAMIRSTKYLPGSPYGRCQLEQMMADVAHGPQVQLQSDKGVAYLKKVARLIEAIGLNLHIGRRVPSHVADSCFVVSSLICRRIFWIRRNLRQKDACQAPIDWPQETDVVASGPHTGTPAAHVVELECI